MRILFLSQYYPPEPGAPAARVSELARAWVRRGHQVTVLTGFPNHPTGVVPTEYAGKLFARENDAGVEVLRTWIYAAANKGKVRRSLAYASYSASAALFGQWFATKPDVLIATSPQLLCAFAGRVTSLARQVPFVLEVRDLWPESIVAVGALSARHPVIRGLTLMEEDLYRRARSIVLVTDGFREKLIERGVDARKLAVIKNGVDLTRFVPRDRNTALRARLGFGDRIVVGYVGTHGMAHGLDAVLDVAKRLGDRVHFLFVGEGAERQRLAERATAEGIGSVTFLGSVPRDEMPEVYATCDLCLVPLRKTDLFKTVLPSKMFEIFAMKRPIVLSVDGEARALGEASGGAIYAGPEDVGEMTAAIETLANDEALRTSMGARAREFVMREFDRDALADRYLDVLRATIAGAPAESA